MRRLRAQEAALPRPVIRALATDHRTGPPPWSAEVTRNCFIVSDANGQDARAARQPIFSNINLQYQNGFQVGVSVNLSQPRLAPSRRPIPERIAANIARNRSNVWDYGGINSFSKHRDELLAMHPTVKPVALIADVIKDASARGDLILDPFGGSGSTVIAAEKTQRSAAVMDIDPLYVDAMVRRWQSFTGKAAICAQTGASFAEREQALGDLSGNGPADAEANRGRR